MWWKKHKWKVIVPVVLAAILAFAFWYGGGAAGSRGWTAPDSAETSDPSAPAETPEQPEQTPDAPSAPGGAQQSPKTAPPPTPSASETPQVSSAPEATPEPSAPPVPGGTPAPSQNTTAADDGGLTCTISISCASLVKNIALLDPAKAELVPADGWILKPVTVPFYEGENVFNVLQRTCKQQKIPMEYSMVPLYQSAYVEGIYNLYQFDAGETSGWKYSVNGAFPSVASSGYTLADGDVIAWVYACDLNEFE